MIRAGQEILVGKVQEHYGRSREEAEREVRDWLRHDPPESYDRP